MIKGGEHMGLFKKKQSDIQADPLADENASQEQMDIDLDEVMKKYDRESNVRMNTVPTNHLSQNANKP